MEEKYITLRQWIIRLFICWKIKILNIKIIQAVEILLIVIIK